MLLTAFMYFIGIFLFFILKFVFLSFSFLFLIEYQISATEHFQPETRIDGFQLSAELYVCVSLVHVIFH